MPRDRHRAARRGRATVVASLLATSIAMAANLADPPTAAAESARAILDKLKVLDDSERAWKDRHRHMRMRISGSGAPRERELDVYERREANATQKAVVFLRGGPDVRGVAFLAFSKKGQAADQWLYLPSGKRVRQITASTRNESFVSSDLTFHDLDLLNELTAWSDADATSVLREAAPADGTPCHVIELRPQRDDIGYRRIVLWLGQTDYVPRQIEFYAEAGDSGWFGLGSGSTSNQPTKRVRQSSISPSGKIPVARRIDVETPAKGSQTRIDVVAVDHDQNLPDALFKQSALEAGPEAVGVAR